MHLRLVGRADGHLAVERPEFELTIAEPLVDDDDDFVAAHHPSIADDAVLPEKQWQRFAFGSRQRPRLANFNARVV